MNRASQAKTSHRLVILGGGVAGLDLATHLAGRSTDGRPLDVTLIDRETAYVWKPMLHTIAAGTSDNGAQETVYAAHALSHAFRYEYGEAVGIDRQARSVTLAPLSFKGECIVPSRIILYDTLVLSVGSQANDFGTSGVNEHCLRIDSRSDAIAFNNRLRVELEPCPGGLNRLGLAIWLACDSLDGLVMEGRHAFSPVGRSARACDRRD